MVPDVSGPCSIHSRAQGPVVITPRLTLAFLAAATIAGGLLALVVQAVAL